MRNRRPKNLVLGLGLWLVLFSGCSDSSSNGSDTSTAAGMATVICPWKSMCGAGSMNTCVGRYLSDDWLIEVPLWQKQRDADRAACLKNANSCDDYQVCISSKTPCEASRCDGDVLVECESGHESAFDCASAGLQCENKRCTVAGATCDVELQCIGDVSLWCPGEYQETPRGQDCSLEGKKCGGFGFCMDDPQTSCQELRCDQNLMVYCLDGISASFDCHDTDPDFTCILSKNEDERACGLPNGNDKCPDDADRCDGSVAVICVSGKSYRMNCSDVGGTCQQEGTNVSCLPEN